MKDYKLIEGATYSKIMIDYQKGGINYFNGSTEERGLYIYFQKVERKQEDGYTVESFAMFEGFKVLGVELGRYSKKKQAEFEEYIRSNIEGLHNCNIAGDKAKAVEIIKNFQKVTV